MTTEYPYPLLIELTALPLFLSKDRGRRCYRNFYAIEASILVTGIESYVSHIQLTHNSDRLQSDFFDLHMINLLIDHF
jgi:hypothetical protein